VLDGSNCMKILGLEMHNLGVYRVCLKSFGGNFLVFFAMLLFYYFILLRSLTFFVFKSVYQSFGPSKLLYMEA